MFYFNSKRCVLVLLPWLIMGIASSLQASHKAVIDSYKTLLEEDLPTSTVVHHYLEIAIRYRHLNLIDSAFYYADRAYQKSRPIGQPTLKAKCLLDMARYKGREGEHQRSYHYYRKALKIYTNLGEDSLRAEVLTSLGSALLSQGYRAKANEKILQSIDLAKKLNNQRLLAKNYVFVSLIHSYTGQLDSSLYYNQKAYRLFEKLDVVHEQARLMNNRGAIFSDRKQYVKAIRCYHRSLQIRKNYRSKKGVNYTRFEAAFFYPYLGLGDAYLTIYEKGMSYFHQLRQKDSAWIPRQYDFLIDSSSQYFGYALKIARKKGNKEEQALCLDRLSKVYRATQQYSKSLAYSQKALHKVRSIQALGTESQVRLTLTRALAKAGNYEKAYRQYQKYVQLKDSLFNKEKAQKIARLQTKHQFQQKMEKRKRKRALEKTRNRYILYSVSGGLLLTLIFFGLLYNRFRTTRQQKQVIEEKNKKLDKRNRQINESIRYAERIQSAMLKADVYLDHQFQENYFILFQPKEAVSGDFYWAYQERGLFFWTVADCTGHGVPGAMMSMIGNILLNESALVKKLSEPAEILQELKRVIIETLRQKGESGEARDGMDMGLCVLNRENHQLQFAGANNPLYIIRQQDEGTATDADYEKKFRDRILYEFRGSQQPVGFEEFEPRPFEQHSISLISGDRLYLFTDGYPDQFGGPQDKKFSYPRFRELLLETSSLSMQEQKEALDQEMREWITEGHEQQIDDICVVGIQV